MLSVLSVSCSSAGTSTHGASAERSGEARLLVSAPIGGGVYAHAWRTPSGTEGECYLVTTDRKPQPHAPAPAIPGLQGAGSCGDQRLSASMPVTAAAPLNVQFAIANRSAPRVTLRDWAPPIVSGFVHPGSGVQGVRVEWRGGSRALRLRGNAFIGGGMYLYAPPFENLPLRVVAFDSAGKVVASKKLDSPGLYPNLKGWKEFTPAYTRWKKNHAG